MKEEKQVTLFMLVTDRDCIIADYSIRSYRKIYRQKRAYGCRHFVLFIYLNCLSEKNVRRYKKKWASYPYTVVYDNAGKISKGEHPYPGQQIVSPEGVTRSCDDYAECYDELWSTELIKFTTPYIATVDADFEVLYPDFYFYLFGELDTHPEYIAASSNHSATAVLYDTYSRRNIVLHERNHTWFCIYRREAFTISTRSHYYYETGTSADEILAFDSAAYFQHDLRINHNYLFAVLPGRFRSSFIHYGAASKNKSLHNRNIGFYRRVSILRTVGVVYGSKSRVASLLNKIIMKTTSILFDGYLSRFRQERSRYVFN